MDGPVLLITPPFTQLNTPYPATAYLKGFLNTRNIPSYQVDLGIEVTLSIFSRKGLTRLFDLAEAAQAPTGPMAAQPPSGPMATQPSIGHEPAVGPGEKSAKPATLSENASRILTLKEEYINTIDSVVLFLQGRNPTLAHQISPRRFLPEASRFKQLDDLTWAFGQMGFQDRAKHIATLYLEDLSDLITECIDPHFGFSRYAEKLARSAGSFDELYEALHQTPTYVDERLFEHLEQYLLTLKPSMVCLSVPFPGNLYAALRAGFWIKSHHPQVKVVMGGGFPNTELRSITDTRVFEFIDFITLDDGEAPIENLVKHLKGELPLEGLKRAFALVDGTVTFFNNASCKDYRQGQVGTPDYSDLWLDRYISAIEVVNPMHSLWSDGRWNKLTMAHGCYWGKCTFCDISLDYIKNYEPLTASILCDRMEEIIAQTGQNGFHFVDEAAPPALMKSLALEIIRRRLTVSWWTNIRFEKSFSRDLCLLLKASGCIAVSGGLEVASDRLLEKIQKGVTVAQVARVTKHFTEAGIMVHAYLMYGFPTQTAQETIDALEVIRQMFAAGILQSAFWHQFTMTAHSPVGMNPEKFMVRKESEASGAFANNDIPHVDPSGADHEAFSYGLKKSLFNFMHGTCLDLPLQKWFDFKVPNTKIAPGYILNILTEEAYTSKPGARVIWLGKNPQVAHFVKSKKGQQWAMSTLTFQGQRETVQINVDQSKGAWLASILEKLSPNHNSNFTLQQVKDNYEASGLEDFELFWDNKPVNTLYKLGLLNV